MNTPHLLVIGGTGFIGHHLLKSVQKKGWQMTSVSLNPPTEERFVHGVRYLHFDIVDKTLVKKHLGEDFDYVVNLGGYINHQFFRDGGRDLIEMHFSALQNLLEVLSRRKLKRFVQIGSSDEYGNAPAPQNEKLREQSISPYSLAKVASTHFLQMLYRTENFPSVTLRLFLTYGPGQDTERFLPQIIKGCLLNKSFHTSAGEQLRDFCYVGDTVQAIISTLQTSNAMGEVINIASGNPITIRTMIETVQELIDGGYPEYGKINYRNGENMSLYASVEKAKSILNWKAETDLKSGLNSTINYYKSIHKINK